MFERFTSPARAAVVLAQEEARVLRHNYIGTEHLLLGLIRQTDGLADEVLTSLGISLDEVRQEVVAAVGTGKHEPKGHIPFTPRAKKTLELALREALSLHHNYIGTEHILLGLLREKDGVAAKVLVKLGADLDRVRQETLRRMPRAELLGEPRGFRRWLRGRVESAVPVGEFTAEGIAATAGHGWSATPAGERGLEEVRRISAGRPVSSQHLLLAALADSDGSAARTLAAMGVDLDALQEAARAADLTGTTDELPEDVGRRGMSLRLADDRLVLELTDRRAVEEARATLGEVGAGEEMVLPGGVPVAESLAEVWLALMASLRAIRLQRVEQAGEEGA